MSNSLAEEIKDLIQKKLIQNQSELLEALEKKGIVVNQSTLSRTMKKLNISKVDGVYCLPEIISDNSNYFDFIKVVSAGEHMLVVKTSPGSASRVAYQIDASQIKGIAGTISGDDTIFVALEDEAVKTKITSEILTILKS